MNTRSQLGIVSGKGQAVFVAMLLMIGMALSSASVAFAASGQHDNPELKVLDYPPTGTAGAVFYANPELKVMSFAPTGTAGTVFYSNSESNARAYSANGPTVSSLHANPELKTLSYAPASLGLLSAANIVNP